MSLRFRVSIPARVPISALALAGSLALLAPEAVIADTPEITSSTFGALRARAIGPAVMSGRVASLDVVASDPVTIFVGTASGGVWRSKDGGTTFEPIFDDHTQSIGAVRVDPSDPDVIWVGTGESWTRNSVSIGDGIYKSTDGGDTWKHVGLEKTERIGAIRIHPENGDIVYVCATGPLFADSDERGVYKTEDGGDTWNKILEGDPSTGCADIDLDPQEPDIVYAALWQFRRSAHFFESGGPGSGLHRSMDGGKTWQQLEKGLPDENLGRIAVAVAPSRPNVVYATVEAEETALYRSDDLGTNWRQINASMNVQMRPFYFSELLVDPTDHQRVYKPGFTLTISVDGGNSFSSLFGGGFGGGIHPDHHALWIHPENPNHVILGTDGGVYISYNRANTWNHVGNLPVSQPYQVSYDMEMPYNVYAGLQDNGSWTATSRGPTNADWKGVGFGDGFWTFAHPEDSNIVFSEFQGGRLSRIDKTLNTTKRIEPYAEEGQEELRFNWNTPIHLSPNDPKTIYFASQHLHRSRDLGETWESLSPDLTTDNPEMQRQKESGGISIDNSTAENRTTIYSISESPKDGKVIWVGTDDGLVQVTRNGGETWAEVSSGMEGAPEDRWITSVAASAHDAGTAFVTVDAHYAGDMAPYVYTTTDYGATWTSLAAENLEGYAHVVAQDAVNPDLLFLGTEWGLWISLDRGKSWARFESDLPKRVAVHDLVVHPRENDLILATHGRGIYIVDDITPLRHLTIDKLAEDVVLLPSKPAEMVTGASAFPFSFGADDDYQGEAPRVAASITYYLKKRHLFGDLRVEIYDQDDKLLASLPGGKRKGLNRVSWPMRYPPPKLPAATNLVPAFLGPWVPEGSYKVKLIKGKNTLESEVALVPDGREPYAEADRKLQQKTALELYAALEELTFLTDSLAHVRDSARDGAEGLRKKDQQTLEAFADSAEGLRTELVSTSDAGWLSGDEKLREKLGDLYGNVTAYDGRPSGTQMDRMAKLMADHEAAGKKVQTLLSTELPKVNSLLTKRQKAEIEPLDQGTWMAENSKLHSGAAGADAAMLLANKKGKRFLVATLDTLWFGL